tara:strand:- start:373 stop:1041 length:669 start_codon:yes stop_codon:yes gene_type:complete
MQRIFDIIFSSVVLFIFAPLLTIIIIILRLTGEGEIFFLQPRIGFRNREFQLWKFSTMQKNSPNIGTGTVTVKNDPRVLPFGYLLRKSKINEIPQLFNILKGDMSFIGPRPQTQRCFNAFPEDLQSIIVQVKPGLSGIGSVVFRDEEEVMCGSSDVKNFYDLTIMPYKGQLECWYVENATLWNYCKLIFVTIWVVFRPKSKIVWSSFNELPAIPKTLEGLIN